MIRLNLLTVSHNDRPTRCFTFSFHPYVVFTFRCEYSNADHYYTFLRLPKQVRECFHKKGQSAEEINLTRKKEKKKEKKKRTNLRVNVHCPLFVSETSVSKWIYASSFSIVFYESTASVFFYFLINRRKKNYT